MRPEWLLSTHPGSRPVQDRPSWRCPAPRREGGERRARAERGALAASAPADSQDGAAAGKPPAVPTGCAPVPELLLHRAPRPGALELGRLLFPCAGHSVPGSHGFTLGVMACTWVPCYTRGKDCMAPVGAPAGRRAWLVGPQGEGKSWWLL